LDLRKRHRRQSPAVLFCGAGLNGGWTFAAGWKMSMTTVKAAREIAAAGIRLQKMKHVEESSQGSGGKVTKRGPVSGHSGLWDEFIELLPADDVEIFASCDSI
jgi:hypothetical protein